MRVLATELCCCCRAAHQVRIDEGSRPMVCWAELEDKAVRPHCMQQLPLTRCSTTKTSQQLLC